MSLCAELIFAHKLHTLCAKPRKKDLDIELWGFRLLFDRLCQRLDFVNKNDKEVNEYGLLLFDSVNPRYDLKLRHKIIEMMRKGTYYSNNKYIIEDPLFVTSKYRNMSQLVDCVAFCTRRYYREKKEEKKSYLDIYCEKYFRIIKDKFYKSETGKTEGWGIKIFPEK